MIIYISADHNGYYLRNQLIQYLKSAGYNVHDDGSQKLDMNDDFPVFASRVANDILSSDDADAKGILICGSGQGIMMAANRFKGIRACLGYDTESVRTARNDDNSNVLCLPAKFLEDGQANLIVETWLNTAFAEAPRFIRRLKELDQLN